MINLDLEFDYPEMPMHFKLTVSQGERVAVIGEAVLGKARC